MHPLTDTTRSDTTYYTRPDTTHTAHVQRMNTALQTRVDSLESTLSLRVTLWLVLVLGIAAAIGRR